MSAFSNLLSQINISTPYGSLAGGKVTVGGAAPELPQPSRLTPAGPAQQAQYPQAAPSGALAWLKANPIAIVAGLVAVVAIIFAIRR